MLSNDVMNVVTIFLLFTSMKNLSPFQGQLTILQNVINNWFTLRDNFSDPHVETLSQTGVSCSYICYHCKICSLSDIFTIIKKKVNFL